MLGKSWEVGLTVTVSGLWPVKSNRLLSNTHLYKITFPNMYKNSKGAKGFFEYFDMSLTLAYTLR